MVRVGPGRPGQGMAKQNKKTSFYMAWHDIGYADFESKSTKKLWQTVLEYGYLQCQAKAYLFWGLE